MRIDLIVIDGQNDFCASGKEPGGRKGSLFVEKANEEAVLVANMIDRLKDPKVKSGHKLDKVHASLDSHHKNDGSHNTSWKRKDGSSPDPFTIVSHQDVRSQIYIPRFSIGVWEGNVVPSYQWALKYTEALEANGRAPLCLWPVHCQIGTWGQNIYDPLQAAFDRWCETTNSWIDYISKGHWVWTEHYSALKADVPDPTRPETQLNVEIIQDVSQADSILWTGWAGSHCLRWTALDGVNYFGQGENEFIRKSVFFEDASASVPDIPGAPFKFTDWRREFLDEMHKRGATITTTTQYLAA